MCLPVADCAFSEKNRLRHDTEPSGLEAQLPSTNPYAFPELACCCQECEFRSSARELELTAARAVCHA